MTNPRKASVRSSALGCALTGLLLTLGASAGSEAFAQAASPVILEYWAAGPPNAQVPGPWWVPLRLLNQPYETWDPKNQSKISKAKLKEFKDFAAEVNNLGRSGRCSQSQDCAFLDVSSDHVSVTGAAAKREVVIHATVLSVEPGWDFPSNMVASLVRARIETVIKGAGLAVGQEIMYLRPWGVLKYGDTILCTSAGHNGLSSDLQGDTGATFDSTDLKVVVLGRKSYLNDSLIETTAAWEFKIAEGRFVSIAGYPILEPAEFTLEDLIQAIKGN